MFRVFTLAVLSLLICAPQPASAHRWFMRTFRFDGGTSADSCGALILSLADKVNQKMVAKGYSKGTLSQGSKAVRLDDVGGSDVSVYLYCSDYSIFVFTGHLPGDDDDFFQILYTTLLNEFVKLRGH